jgi:hypothetical protein
VLETPPTNERHQQMNTRIKAVVNQTAQETDNTAKQLVESKYKRYHNNNIASLC